MLTIIKLILYYFAYQLGFSALFMGLSHLAIPMDMVTMTSLAMLASTLVMAWHLIHFGYIRLAQDRYREVTLPVLGVSIVFVFAAMYVMNLLIEQANIPNTMEETFIAMSGNPLGMIFGWLYYRTGSMLPGIVGHILNNSLACINMMLYGNATIEEQMSTPLAMWAWATVAIVAGGAAAVWLNRHIGREETGAR